MENKIVNESTSIKGDEYFVSLAPHLRSDDSVSKIMLDVIIALVPAMIGSVYFFGVRAALLLATCIICCVGSEFIFQKLMHKEIQIKDLSSVVTGILLAFNLPPEFPIWMAAFGSIFAIIIVKECFGGIGFNFMNPALTARIVLMASWGKDMTKYISPEQLKMNAQAVSQATDAMSSATPLQLMKVGTFDQLPSLTDMAVGNIGGVIGETSAILLLIGALYLVFRKVISLTIPVVYIATTAVFLLILGIPMDYVPYELLAGGLFLGAFFMATDYTTTPMTNKGRIIFAIGCGVITAVIRTKANLPEGVSYSIALMNVATPLIDKFTRTKAYGEAK